LKAFQVQQKSIVTNTGIWPIFDLELSLIEEARWSLHVKYVK
jgi:hypothetical protein